MKKLRGSAQFLYLFYQLLHSVSSNPSSIDPTLLLRRSPSESESLHLSNTTSNDYACRPIGPCKPCPIEERSTSPCEIYHNRKRIECFYLGSKARGFKRGTNDNLVDLSSAKTTVSESQPKKGYNNLRLDNVPYLEIGSDFSTWEACERVVSKERKDFFEFVTCNVIIAVVSLLVYGFRTKQLVIKQYTKLASRIGILPI
ncbi:expressed protein [Phakopsora pachyrhizi]|uniref:Expressed protein n=1 Tax=Phakopsora pachyrhizi TaxID=170000 RepID=A0AAV0BDS1_PHAPC|nr:expressed protein [Phakopsora pachyrhizi]